MYWWYQKNLNSTMVIEKTNRLKADCYFSAKYASLYAK